MRIGSPHRPDPATVKGDYFFTKAISPRINQYARINVCHRSPLPTWPLPTWALPKGPGGSGQDGARARQAGNGQAMAGGFRRVNRRFGRPALLVRLGLPLASGRRFHGDAGLTPERLFDNLVGMFEALWKTWARGFRHARHVAGSTAPMIGHHRSGSWCGSLAMITRALSDISRNEPASPGEGPARRVDVSHRRSSSSPCR